ncbi:MAG: GntP family permease [Pseudonocardia sp.]|nr:GntP family permease [Pseudonocardia sp.]
MGDPRRDRGHHRAAGRLRPALGAGADRHAGHRADDRGAAGDVPARDAPGHASHVNDGGFWIVAKYFNMSVQQTLKTWTVLETILSVVGFAAAGLMWLVV